MPRPILSVLAALVALAALAPAASSQDRSDLRRVVLVDGSVLVGFVADESADPVVITTEDGVEQRVPRARVAEITPLIGGRFYRLDPTRTRTIIAPTGRTLGGGKVRLGSLVYLLPNVTVGLNDRVDLGGTALLTFGDSDLFLLPVLGAKVNLVDTGSFAAAVGSSLIVPLSSGDEEGFVIFAPYGAVTVGDELRAVSASVTGLLGGSFDSGDVEVADGVIFTLGGEVQLNNGVKLLADVYLPIGEGTSGTAFLPGVRFFGDRFSVDVYGALVGLDGSFGGFAPIANFAYTF